MSPIRLKRRSTITRAVSALVLSGALQSCAGMPSNTPTPGRSVDFSFVRGEKIEQLSSLRGRPVVLVLMRTSELPSYVYVREIKTVFEQVAGEIQFLVLTIEPNEAPFTKLFQESEELPFKIGVAEWAVAIGQSPLGLVPIVPATYFIDASGKVVGMAEGLVLSADLTKKIQHHFHR